MHLLQHKNIDCYLLFQLPLPPPPPEVNISELESSIELPLPPPPTEDNIAELESNLQLPLPSQDNSDKMEQYTNPEYDMNVDQDPEASNKSDSMSVSIVHKINCIRTMAFVLSDMYECKY